MTRKCEACGFISKSGNNSALTRHVNKCLVARGIKRRRVVRDEAISVREDQVLLYPGLDVDVNDDDTNENGPTLVPAVEEDDQVTPAVSKGYSCW